MWEENSGYILATLLVRNHVASVDIRYDPERYFITYNGSTNLNYDGLNIHPNYNKWVRNLNRTIQLELSSLHDSSQPI
jgi:hypothetical protein